MDSNAIFNVLTLVSALLGAVVGIVSATIYIVRTLKSMLGSARASAEVGALDKIAAISVQEAEQMIPNDPKNQDDVNAKRKARALSTFLELAETRGLKIDEHSATHYLESAVFAKNLNLDALPLPPDKPVEPEMYPPTMPVISAPIQPYVPPASGGESVGTGEPANPVTNTDGAGTLG